MEQIYEFSASHASSCDWYSFFSCPWNNLIGVAQHEVLQMVYRIAVSSFRIISHSILSPDPVFAFNSPGKLISAGFSHPAFCFPRIKALPSDNF